MKQKVTLLILSIMLILIMAYDNSFYYVQYVEPKPLNLQFAKDTKSITPLVEDKVELPPWILSEDVIEVKPQPTATPNASVVHEVNHQSENISSKYTNEGRVLKVRSTAYCACSKCCGKWANGITATGTVATQGRTIAVDQSVIPLGSKVSINGQIYVAEDTGSGVNGNSIDLYFESHSEALNWGVRNLEVIVLE